jgi:hypothetical protein
MQLLLPSAGLVKDAVCIPNGNPTHGGKTCVTGHECSNNGDCAFEKCVCKPGFRGDHCQYGPTCTTQYFVFADSNGNGLVEKCAFVYFCFCFCFCFCFFFFFFLWPFPSVFCVLCSSLRVSIVYSRWVRLNQPSSWPP